MTTENNLQIPDVQHDRFDIRAMVGKNIGPITIFPIPPRNGSVRAWEDRTTQQWAARLLQCYNACEDVLDTTQFHLRTRENPRMQIAHHFIEGLEPHEVAEIKEWMRRIDALIQALDASSQPSRPTRR